MSAPLLYVHPHNHAFPKVLPLGSIAALNLLAHPKLGRFAGEVTSEELAAARVVLLDVHWFLPLAILGELLRRIRQVNPEAAVIAGGITASFYADILLARFADLDYVVAGHVERSLPGLVDHLMAGEAPPRIPGVHDRRGATLASVPPSAREFDDLDWLTVDWFPTYQAEVRAIHANHPTGLDPHPYQNVYYPRIVAARGCHRRCHHCAGSYQDRVFGPNVLRRSPDAFMRDLERVEADPHLKFVTLLFADTSTLPPYAARIAERRFDLDALVFFCGGTPRSVLRDLRSGFRGSVECSVLQPADLRGWQAKPPSKRVKEEQAFRDTVAHIRELADTRAVVFHIEHPLLDGLQQDEDADAGLRFESGAEWCIRRPDATELTGNGDLVAQFDDVLAAAEQAKSAFLLPLLVPTFRQIPVVAAAADGVPTEGLDPFEERIVRLSEEEIRHSGAYGFTALTLHWTSGEGHGDGGLRWAPPGRPAEGPVTWYATAEGYGWKGEVTVGSDRPQLVGVAPVIHFWKGEQVALASWSGALLPTLVVEPGPDRVLHIRARTAGTRISVTVVDRGRVASHTLDPPSSRRFTPSSSGEVPTPPRARRRRRQAAE